MLTGSSRQAMLRGSSHAPRASWRAALRPSRRGSCRARLLNGLPHPAAPFLLLPCILVSAAGRLRQLVCLCHPCNWSFHCQRVSLHMHGARGQIEDPVAICMRQPACNRVGPGLAGQHRLFGRHSQTTARQALAISGNGGALAMFRAKAGVPIYKECREHAVSSYDEAWHGTQCPGMMQCAGGMASCVHAAGYGGVASCVLD